MEYWQLITTCVLTCTNKYSSQTRVLFSLQQHTTLLVLYLVHVLGAEHHVLLGLAILSSNRIENLLLIWKENTVGVWTDVDQNTGYPNSGFILKPICAFSVRFSNGIRFILPFKIHKKLSRILMPFKNLIFRQPPACFDPFDHLTSPALWSSKSLYLELSLMKGFEKLL